MNFTDQVVGALATYGIPALFVILAVASAGMPAPVTLLLVVAGSFVAQGEMSMASVVIAGSLGAITGDQIGYFAGRWGGRKLAARTLRFAGGEARLRQAEELTRKYGGAGIFFSRWLLTPLGPPLNLTSGITEYPWGKFLLWDAAGELLWVSLYVVIGRIFSDRVETIADTLGNFTWLIIGAFAVLILGWKLFGYLRGGGDKSDEKTLARTNARVNLNP